MFREKRRDLDPAWLLVTPVILLVPAASDSLPGLDVTLHSGRFGETPNVLPSVPNQTRNRIPFFFPPVLMSGRLYR